MNKWQPYVAATIKSKKSSPKSRPCLKPRCLLCLCPRRRIDRFTDAVWKRLYQSRIKMKQRGHNKNARTAVTRSIPPFPAFLLCPPCPVILSKSEDIEPPPAGQPCGRWRGRPPARENLMVTPPPLQWPPAYRLCASANRYPCA